MRTLSVEEAKERKQELIDYILENVTNWNDEPQYTQEQLEKMSSSKLVDIWCNWEGLINYSSSILETVEQAFGIEF